MNDRKDFVSGPPRLHERYVASARKGLAKARAALRATDPVRPLRVVEDPENDAKEEQ